MNRALAIIAGCAAGLAALSTVGVSRASAQDPILTPIIVGEAAPIVVKTLTPKPKPTGLKKFQGYVVNANVAQVTVRSKADERAIQTFSLNQTVSTKMQKIVDNGGYQFGDKVTVYYDPRSHVAMKIKGKPSRPL
jgi:hypothetical protein